MFLLLVVVSLLVALVFGAAFRRKNYWKSRGVKGPEPVVFLGNLDVLGNPVDTQQPQVYHKWTQKYGPIYGILRGWKPAIVVGNHALANEVLYDRFETFHGRDHAPVFGDEDKEPIVNVFVVRGKRWRRMRAIGSSSFTGKNLKAMFAQVSSCSDAFIENLETDIRKNGNEVDIKINFHEYTGDVICRLGFLQHHSRESLQRFLPAINKMLKMPGSWIQYGSWVAPQLWRLFKFFQVINIFGTNLGIFKFIFALNKTMKAQKEERAKSDQKGPVDFLNIFLDYESSDVKLENNQLYDKRSDKIVKEMSTQEVLGMTFMFIFAGYDTVASTASFMIYRLATNPEIQEKLRKEVFEVCGNQDPTYEQMQELKYLDSVLKETLRFNPIGASVTSRKAACDTELDGIPIKADTHILIDVISIHKDPSLWGPDADEFKPERWLGEDSAKLMGHFYGFGAGPRVCVGMKLAYAEIRLVMVKMLQRYRIKPTPQINDAMNVVGFVAGPKSVPVLLEQL